MHKVRIITTVNPDGVRKLHLVNSIQQSEALKRKIDEERIRFNKEMERETRNTLVSIAIALAALAVMYWLCGGFNNIS